MNPNHWKQIQTLFHRAVSLNKDQRLEVLEQAYSSDTEVGKCLERLLREDSSFSAEWEEKLILIAKSCAAEATPALPAEPLGPYRFIRCLGKGGMGIVYQAQHRDTGQIVAIKVLRAGELSSASRERFATEKRALAKLNHPSIARLYGSDSFRDGTPCFVMEYVDGETVTQFCQKNKCSVRERVVLLRQVCEAVQHAHEHAIIHRDLKPGNILVRREGDIRLLDFGIAKQLDAQEQALTVTGALPAPMTLAYAAPEQVTGAAVGIHTDVYGLGATLYEVLTGRQPLELANLTPGGIETAICHELPNPPSKVASGSTVSGFAQSAFRAINWKDLDVICATAMHKDPLKRYRSVDALKKDLDHWLHKEPLDARQDGSWYHLNRFAQRNWRVLSAALLVFALLTTGTLLFVVRLSKARDEALHEQARTKRVQQFVFSLFDNGDAESVLRKDTTARTILDRGRKQAETLQGEPEFQTELYAILGGLYQKLGSFDDASRLLSTVAATRKAANVSSAKAAKSLIAISFLKADQSRLAESEQFAREGLKILRQNTGATQEETATALLALGQALLMSRKYQEAKPTLEEALRSENANEFSSSEKTRALNLLAQVEQEAGNFQDALKFGERALEGDFRIFGKMHPRIADDYETIGAIRQNQFHFPEAEDAYGKALQIYDSWYGGEHPKTVELKVLLGTALAYDGKYDKARQSLKESVTGLRVSGPKDPKIVLALGALGTLEQKTGHVEASRDYFEQALEGAILVYGDGTYVSCLAKANLATLELDARNFSRAERLYRNGLADLENVHMTQHVDFGRLQMNLGKALFLQRRYLEAEETLKAGISLLGKNPDKRPKELEKAQAMLSDAHRLAALHSKNDTTYRKRHSL